MSSDDKRYPTNVDVWPTLTDRQMNQCYTTLDGSFGGYMPPYPHSIKHEDIHLDPDEEERRREALSFIREYLPSLFHPDFVHLALHVFPSKHGAKSEVASTKVVSRSKIRNDEKRLWAWVFILSWILMELKRRRLM